MGTLTLYIWGGMQCHTFPLIYRSKTLVLDSFERLVILQILQSLHAFFVYVSYRKISEVLCLHISFFYAISD